jgi:hypothetical protein
VATVVLTVGQLLLEQLLLLLVLSAVASPVSTVSSSMMYWSVLAGQKVQVV